VDTEKCIYKQICPKDCSPSCIRWLEMSYLLEHSNLPEHRWTPIQLFACEEDRDAYRELGQIKNNVVDFVKSGSNIFITSHSVGNGKTSWAIKLMLKYFDSIWAGNGFRCRGLFLHIPTLLMKLKDFDKPDSIYAEIKDLIPTVDLVIWDDVGSIKLSAYDYNQLLMLLEQRINNGKTNIFTSNYDEKDLQEALGVKLASRICHTSKIIQFKGGDRRNG